MPAIVRRPRHLRYNQTHFTISNLNKLNGGAWRLNPENARVVRTFTSSIRRVNNPFPSFHMNYSDINKLNNAIKVISKYDQNYANWLRTFKLNAAHTMIREGKAANKIQTAWRASRALVNSPSKRTLNNPAWARRVTRLIAASHRKESKKPNTSSSPLPNIPREWGKWFGPYSNQYMSENGRWKYYKNSNRLMDTKNDNKVYTNARTRFRIPF